MADDAKQCPWCGRWALKDRSCNYVFACGLAEDGRFVAGAGCGRSWCWACGKKLCGQYCDPVTGAKLRTGRESHDARCCPAEEGYIRSEYCEGGHDSHCERR